MYLSFRFPGASDRFRRTDQVFNVQHVLIAYGLFQSVSIDRLIDSASGGVSFKFTCLQRNLQRSKKSGVHIEVNSLITHALTPVSVHQC
ncbi:hypothetical protein EG68_05053 [Paragonimus skrjabini miyazakii]|uniref:Uncharacterized protein n=1 Tax=Paragonimus skrjabini miyazakii TaxID=59628 RepID=A0A8S9Z225_9TREM|nr:hypothetical protein EG68_05053 [Paragonimus skrjabini miyazakii]